MPLFIAGSITVVVTMVIFYLDNKTKFGKLNPFIKQTIIGICFGLCAAYATEVGSVSVNGAALNCRDAGPVISGLLFGPWAGVLAGAIGAFDRFFIATPIFGIGAYTQAACSIATLFAGCIAGLFNVIMFRKHRPLVLNALVFILVVEVVHMSMVPLFHMDDIVQATMVMYSCFLPLLGSNAAAVAVAFFITSYMNMRMQGHKIKDIILGKDIFFSQDLFFSFQFWLLAIIAFAFVVIVAATAFFSDQTARIESEKHFNSDLTSMKKLILQDAATLNLDHKLMARIYARDWSDEEVVMYFIVDNNTNQIISTQNGNQDVYESTLQHADLDLYHTDVGATRYYVMYTDLEDFKIVAYSLEKYEMFIPHLNSSFILFVLIFVFGILMFSVFLLLNRLVGQNLEKINETLDKITEGNLDEKVDVYSHKEFANLSNRINSTVDTLKDYIQAEADRFKEDFEMAKQIQLSALPSVFPPFPERPEIDIFAKYQSAKEVGGDFYDYYFVGENKLAFLMADVSGKGIPAAMFMMRAKTAIRVFAEKHQDAAKALEASNNYLCENNEAELFVTCWLGLLDTKTGRLQYASAGHNPPVIMNPKTGKCEFKKSPVSLVLGGMEDVPFKNFEYEMKEGEKILLYTDGITEAHNSKSELYGDDRLIELGKKHLQEDVNGICDGLFEDVFKFQGEADQFDDMTCLALHVKKLKRPKIEGVTETEITVMSKIENVSTINDRVEEFLSSTKCPKDFMPKFCVAVDEIFSNIVKYGYNDENYYVTVRLEVDERDPKKKAARLIFVDSADRFNPLDKSAPDTSLSAEERKIGGLGIYMVRKLMDDVFYIYKDDENNLTIVKYFGEKKDNAANKKK